MSIGVYIGEYGSLHPKEENEKKGSRRIFNSRLRMGRGLPIIWSVSRIVMFRIIS
jgi:hypothetical protein